MDSLLELEVNDGRRPATKAAKRFEKELRRRLKGWYGKKHKPEQEFEIVPLVNKYRLMMALQGLTIGGETTYLMDYLRVSDSLRADLRALNISGLIPEPDKDDEIESPYDLSKLSIPELRVLRFLTQKASGEPVQGYDIYDALSEIMQGIQPVSGLLEYKPNPEPVVVEKKVVRTKQPKHEIEPLPIQQQGETEEEREERIRFYHWDKMMKARDKGPWEE